MRVLRFALLVVAFLCSTMFGKNNPLPFVNQPLVPDSAVPGSASFTLTVNGTGFVSGATVNWNGSPRSTTFITSSQLQAVILASDIATPRTAYVTATNPSPGGGASAAALFQVTVPAPSAYFQRSVIQLGDYGNEGFAVAGDFNGDGNQDLVYWLQGLGVVLQLGNGDGTFQKGKVVSTKGYPSTPVDVNGDGKLDLVVTDATNFIWILLGNGDGTFKSPKYFYAGNQPYSPVTGDFNGDGKLDIAVVNTPDNSISILLGNGDGTFQSPISVSVPGESPFTLAVGDFNRDGNLDLAVGNLDSTFFSILLGNGDGTFKTGQLSLVPFTLTFGMMAADFNNDGKLDLIVNDDYLPMIFLGNGDGTFQQGSVIPGYDGFSFSAADMNADNKLDWVGTGQHSVTLNLGNSDGIFPRLYSTYAGSGFPSQNNGAVVADFNNDGKLDTATVNYVSNISAAMTILVQGSAVLTPRDAGFGYLPPGKTTAPHTITLTNGDVSSISVSAFNIKGTNAADFSQSNNCPSTLSSGASCQIQVVFTPSAVGSEQATLQVVDGGTGGMQSAQLSGHGTLLTASPNPAAFGTYTVGTKSQPKKITITNTGQSTLTFSTASIIGESGFGFNVSSSDCGQLAPGGECHVYVTFEPLWYGFIRAGLTVQFDGDQIEVALRGEGH